MVTHNYIEGGVSQIQILSLSEHDIVYRIVSYRSTYYRYVCWSSVTVTLVHAVIAVMSNRLLLQLIENAHEHYLFLLSTEKLQRLNIIQRVVGRDRIQRQKQPELNWYVRQMLSSAAQKTRHDAT